jgi:aryl-alcohol dehydrogenase-like predicted oxidoreductase
MAIFLPDRRTNVEDMTKLGNTDLDVYGLNLGGNVFGWTADEPRSFAVLDAYTAAGGNFVDSADLYGGGGGSEEILGNWLAARGNRDDVVVATKVGLWDGRPGLSAKNIQAAAEDSLRRLKTDHIDLYYAHRDDPDTPLVEREGLATLPYFALAKGFLTGKYRTKDEPGDSPRAARATSYLDNGGERVLTVLDEVAQAHGVSVATVSLAWLRVQPTVAAPIASARTPEQLTDLIASVSLELTADEIAALSRAGDPTLG